MSHQKRVLPVLAALLCLALTGCGTQAVPEVQTTAAAQATAAATATHAAEGDIAVPDAMPNGETSTAASTAPAASEQTPDASAAQTSAEEQLGPLFLQYVRGPVADRNYTLTVSQSGLKMVTVIRGNDSMLDSSVASLLRVVLIHRGGEYYMLSPKTKKYIRMDEQEYQKQVDSLSATDVDTEHLRLTDTGTQTLGGKTYSTETYDEGDRGMVTYYFDSRGVQRVRVVKDGKTTDSDLFTVSDEVDDAVFDIPSDYTAVTDPSQLFV